MQNTNIAPALSPATATATATSSPAPATATATATAPVNSSLLNLESLLKKIISDKITGKENILNAAKDLNVNLKYSAIRQKLTNYVNNGINGLRRKQNNNKGEPVSFHPEVLKLLTEKFFSKTGGVVINAYKETHDYLRSVSASFVKSDTGEEFRIINNYLCDISNEKIISAQTTLYSQGVYTLNSGEELSVGSYSSASRFLNALKKENPYLDFYNRYGIYDFRNKLQHTMKLNYSNLQPFDLIIGDGKQLDIICITDDWKRVARPWLFGWYDAATRMYCYHLGFSETAENLCHSLASAIIQWGIPKVCKHDNGKAYLSSRFSQMKKSFNIETTLARVKLARAKPIESFHNVLDQLFRTSIGYTGNKYQLMPEDTRNRLRLVAGHQRDIAKLEKEIKEENNIFLSLPANPEARLKTSKNRFMHISELVSLIDRKLEEYHERIHGGLEKDSLGKEVKNINCADELINELGTRFNSPDGRYEYYLKKGFQPVTAAPDTVSLFTMNFDIRTVQIRTGISFNNEEFFSPKLVPLAGRKVLFRYVNLNSDELYVFTSDALRSVELKRHLTPEIVNSLKFVCIAEKTRMLDYNDPSYSVNIENQRREEKSLRLALKDSRSKSNIIAFTGVESELASINQAEEELAASKLAHLKTKKFKNAWDD